MGEVRACAPIHEIMRKDSNGSWHFYIGIKFTILLFAIAILVLVLFSYRSDKHGNLFGQVEKLIPHHPGSAFYAFDDC